MESAFKSKQIQSSLWTNLVVMLMDLQTAILISKMTKFKIKYLANNIKTKTSLTKALIESPKIKNTNSTVLKVIAQNL